MMKRHICIALLLLAGTVGLQAQDRPKAYLVSTAHFDNQWNWDIRESIDDYLHRTMVQNFYLFERFPEYVFNFESAQKYAWMKEYYPADFERVREYVKAGRWNVSGSTWEANDPNMPAAESFFRNILLGQEFYKREFGVKANDIYLPDCFGFGYTLPTIASHCGLIGFSTQKLQWRKNVYYGEPPQEMLQAARRSMWALDNKYKIPFPIGLWQGIDGSRIMAALDSGGYGTSYFYDDITVNDRIIKRAESGAYRTAYSYYGVGDRGGSPTIPSVWSMEQGLDGGEGPLELVNARSGQMYEDFYPFENYPDLPVFDGELTMDVHGAGCYTSQAMLKLFNRRNEYLALAAEKASVAAELLGGLEYPDDEIRSTWQRLLWHQFHDDLTGTSIPRSYTFTWNDHMIVQQRFSDMVTVAAGAVARTLDTDVSGIPLVVYNPLASVRKDVVKAVVDMPERPSGIKVVSPKGSVPAQLLSWQDGKAEIIFSAETAPVSFTVFNVLPSGSRKSQRLKVTSNSLENQIYKVTLDKNGDISSVYDKRYGRELVREGEVFGLQVLTDNVSMEYPAWEVFRKTLDGPSVRVCGNVRMSVVEEGPLRATIKVERDFEGSHIVQYISLTDGAADDRIEVLNEVDWASKNAMLKASFPTSVSNEKTAYDLGLGYIERGVNTDYAFEVIGHEWADLVAEDGSYGIAVLNDSKYGWDKPDSGTIRLTLLNTPYCEGSFYHYQGHQDHGHHTFRYAITGHSGSLDKAAVDTKAEAFNQPLPAFVTSKHDGKRGRTMSLVSVSSPQVNLLAVKKAEDGNGYIVRVNERLGKDYEDVSLTFDVPVLSAVATNGIEEGSEPVRFSGNSITFSGKAFQPKTFRVVLAGTDELEKPVNVPVELPYNAVAFTSDEFNRAGNFDGRGNSLAAELMPQTVVSDGIAFNVNNDPVVRNFVRCDGQTVLLPEGSGADKLFLLVTSTHGDRKTVFEVDGSRHELMVPYYTDFYGQWGWTGESEGYLKEGSFGYIADHKHCAHKGNDSYSFAYLYKFCIDIEPGVRELVLPKDAGIALFAVTLSDSPNHETQAASQMKVIPKQTKDIEWQSRTVPFFNERSQW